MTDNEAIVSIKTKGREISVKSKVGDLHDTDVLLGLFVDVMRGSTYDTDELIDAMRKFIKDWK